MKRSLKSLFSLLVLTVALTLAGCSANSISGPDLEPEARPDTAPTTTYVEDAPHNFSPEDTPLARSDDGDGEQNGSGGGSINPPSDPHNRTGEDDD